MNLKPPALVLAAVALLLAAAAGTSLGGGAALSLGWYGDGYCDDAEAANPGGSGDCRYDVLESACADAVDNDSDERTDCLDSDCVASLACARGCIPAAETCANGADDDCDGLADGADPDCGDCAWYAFLWCDEDPVCGDGTCDAGESCAADCGVTCVATAEICGDGVDQDCSGADLPCDGCSGYDVCNAACPEYSRCDCDPGASGCGTTCANSCDSSNCEGYDLCTCNPSDPSCQGGGCVPTAEECGNAADDDCDGAADCDDDSCAESVLCRPIEIFSEVCHDSLDNDKDGQIDCRDEDCDGKFARNISSSPYPCWRIHAYNDGQFKDYDCDESDETTRYDVIAICSAVTRMASDEGVRLHVGN